MANLVWDSLQAFFRRFSRPATPRPKAAPASAATPLTEAAALTGAAPDEIALQKNTSEGVSTVAFGLDWKAGDNLVLPRGEFLGPVCPGRVAWGLWARGGSHGGGSGPGRVGGRRLG